MEVVFTSIVAFTVVLLLLVLILLYAQSKLVQSGDVKIIINGDEANPVVASAGSTLLSTLSGQKIFLPSACYVQVPGNGRWRRRTPHRSRTSEPY